MANQAKNQKSKLLYLGIIAVAVVIAFYVFKVVGERGYTLQGNNSNLTSNGSKIYTSNTLKFSISVPSNYNIQGTEISVNLINGDEEINIGRNGTNYENINGYLGDLSSKNKITYANKEELTIDNNQAIRTIIKHPVSGDLDNLTYFIYKDYFVYRFSTSALGLYGDLDNIARSFRYAP